MKLNELKHKVYRAWKDLNSFKGILAQPNNFKPEVRTFGDLRKKHTWVKALARFSALNSYQSCLDAYTLILYDFNFTPNRWDYEFRHQIMEEFLLMPDALDLIKLGFEQLFSSDFTPQEREQAHGFLGLVGEQAGRRLIGESIGHLRKLPELVGTSAP
jgi:hypothetical protein